MKKIYVLGVLLFSVLSFGQTNVGITGNVGGVYINEIHYDNLGTDVGEFIEVAGPAGTDLSTYTITLYNGNGNVSYNTTILTGIIDDEGTGVGSVSFPITGIQNGDPDGIALSKAGSNDVQYLSYDGVMTAPATNGPAMGLNSVNILVTENPNATNSFLGYSLEYDENSSVWIVITDDTPGLFAQGPQLTLSISDNSIEGLKIYPTPAKNFLYITSNNNEAQEATFYNSIGKEVLKTKVLNTPINIETLSKGIYVLKVVNKNKITTKKLIID